jgi:hypothetical protein
MKEIMRELDLGERETLFSNVTKGKILTSK